MDTSTKYGGFWIRVVAGIIDSIPITIFNVVVFGTIIGFLMADSGYSPGEIIATEPWVRGFLSIFTGFVYFAAFESSKMQGTPGKRIVGLKVVDLGGRRILFGRATGRHFSKIISGFILFIGFLMVGWTNQKQGLHDKTAGTLVIKSD